MRIRPAQACDHEALASFLARWNALRVARRGALEHALDHPALVAERDGRLVGVLTYVVTGAECEVLTLHVDERRQGVGTALIAEAIEIARRQGCTRLWLITTNDNVDALRFYQRRGFRLAALHRGAVDESRAQLKPEIPNAGSHGIPLHDELELEREIPADEPTVARPSAPAQVTR